jgi:asparagine synthase (glutamine-hydrolysing)
MHHSVESRVPYLDYRFVEYALATDDEIKFVDGYLKYPLRKMVEERLPKEIVWRTDKIGYESPNDIWLRAIESRMDKTIEESRIIEEYVEDGLKQNLGLKWKLYILALWEKKYDIEIKEHGKGYEK